MASAPRFIVETVLENTMIRTIREPHFVVDSADPERRRVSDGYSSKRAASMDARAMNELETYVWRGYVTLDGRTSLELEVVRNYKKFQNRGTRFLLVRVASGSGDGFRFVEDALAHGSRINPKIEWKIEALTLAELEERSAQ